MKPHLKQVYDIIVEAAKRNQYAPSRGDIAEVLGITADAAQARIIALVKQGSIEKITKGAGSTQQHIFYVPEFKISTQPSAKRKMGGYTEPKNPPPKYTGPLGDAIKFLQGLYSPVCSMKSSELGGPSNLFLVSYRHTNLTADEVINMAETIKERRAARREECHVLNR